MSQIGAHVSTAGGLDKAIDRAVAMGANAIQIFGSSPQSWARRTPSEAQIATFRSKAQAAKIAAIFIHGAYLINLATANPDNLAKSEASLIADLRLASQIGASGVVFHVGSHKGAGFEQVCEQVTRSMKRILDETPDDTWLIIENNAGQGQQIGATFAEVGALIKAVGSPRVKVCLDTCHAYSSGYDIATVEGLAATLAEFDREIGVNNLVVIHANDSKAPFRSGIDRHENIGKGHIGAEGFRVLLHDAVLRCRPFILEVPGFANEGPDKENIDILNSLAQP